MSDFAPIVLDSYLNAILILCFLLCCLVAWEMWELYKKLKEENNDRR